MKTTTHPPLPSPANPARYDGHGGEFSAPEGWSAEQVRAYYDLAAARIAELEAEIAAVGAGGVQALSAGPAGWKLVPVEPTQEMLNSPSNAWPADAKVTWAAMLAASPTPPAEQPGTPPDGEALSAGPAASIQNSGWFTKKPVTVAAAQWFKNGDHPLDHEPIEIKNPTAIDLEKYYDYKQSEGKVVRYYRHPGVPGESPCEQCGKPHHAHGWVDTLEQGHRVCPGDWIITGVKGERYPCKPDIFQATYTAASPTPPAEQPAQPGAVYAELPRAGAIGYASVVDVDRYATHT